LNGVGGFLAGAIVGRMVLDTSKWSASVTKVKADQKTLGGLSARTAQSFQRMGRTMTIAGAALLGTMGGLVREYARAGDEVHKMGLRTGFTAERLSELQYAAQISGTNLNALEKGVKRMAKTITDASEGMTTYQRAFDRIGVNYEALAQLSPEQQFDAIAEAIARVEDPTIRAATAQDIFGRAGTQLLPLFDQGVDGMRRLSEKAHELGRIYDEEAAAKAARLVDAQTSLKTAFQGLAVSLAENIVPALSKLVEGISSIVGKFNQWAQEHPGLASAITKVGIGVGALVTALGPLVVRIPRIITGVKGLAVALKFLTGPMGLVAAGATAIAVALLKQKAAQDAATESAKRSAEAEDDLFRRIKAATDAAGMSDLAFLKLTEKYHHNAAAMAMAIKRGKEGEELQKALIEVSKKHYDTKREETGAVEELSIAFDQKLLPAMTAVAEKQESWIEFLRDQGLQTISQKQERANELYTIIDNLNAAYERGEISTATWAEAVKTATKEIEALTSAEYVEVGASRDLSTAIQQVSHYPDPVDRHLQGYADRDDILERWPRFDLEQHQRTILLIHFIA